MEQAAAEMWMEQLTWGQQQQQQQVMSSRSEQLKQAAEASKAEASRAEVSSGRWSK